MNTDKLIDICLWAQMVIVSGTSIALLFFYWKPEVNYIAICLYATVLLLCVITCLASRLKARKG